MVEEEDLALLLGGGPNNQEGIVQALFLCAPFLFKKGKCSPFLELTPKPPQMQRDIMNIYED